MARSEERPPQPPPFERKIRIAPVQRIGIPLLLLLPILALFQVFGGSYVLTSVQNERLALEVHYPTRSRYRFREPLSISVTHLTSTKPVTLTLHFDRAYLEHFSATFHPDITRITETEYEIELPAIDSGSTRRVDIELLGNDYGGHSGTLTLVGEEGPPLEVPIETFIFP